jgi:hypothetical protein
MSIENKLDRVLEDIAEIKVTQARHHEVLKDHIRRTEILENAIKPSRIIALLAALAAIIESLHWAFK